MKKFCMIANKSKPGALELAAKIKKHIEAKGGTCVMAESDLKTNHAGIHGSYTETSSIPADAECALVLGGDGTFLRAARELGSLDIPLFGINMGSLGFLTRTEAINACEAIDKLMADEHILDLRMQLEVKKESEKGTVKSIALNDIVVSRGGYSHLVGIEVKVNGKVFASYEGDGVIVSTPTGSTGYNLSTGGPIVSPHTGVILITPICPHAMNARSFVISAEDKVIIKLKGNRHDISEDAYVTVDGEEYGKMKSGDEIAIEKSERSCKMCMLPTFSFIDMLNTKIN
jgi:NAD+ kinase